MIDDTVFKNIVNERSIVTPGIKWIPKYFRHIQKFPKQYIFRPTWILIHSIKQYKTETIIPYYAKQWIKLTKNKTFPNRHYIHTGSMIIKNWEPAYICSKYDYNFKQCLTLDQSNQKNWSPAKIYCTCQHTVSYCHRVCMSPHKCDQLTIHL